MTTYSTHNGPDILSRLRGVRQLDSRRWSALCPQHPDSTITIFDSDGIGLIASGSCGCGEKRIYEAAKNQPEATSNRAERVAHQTEAEWDRPIPFHDAGSLPPFPTAGLPDWWRAHVEAIALATQTPVDMAAALSLAAIATCVQGRLRIEVRPGYWEPLNLYVACVMEPGNRKSAVLRAVAAPIEQCEREEAERLRPELEAATSQRRMNEKRLARAEEDASKCDSEERRTLEEGAKQLATDLAQQKTPASPRLLADDSTPEQLVTLMTQHGGRMAVLSAEGTIFELMCGRYDKNGKENLGIFLKAHAGDAVIVDRRQVQEHIERPALTIGVAVQPEVIRGLMRNEVLRGRGLLARVLYSLPASFVGRRRMDAPTVPPDVADGYAATIRALLAAPIPDDASISLMPEAALTWEEYATRIEARLGPDCDLRVICDWASKLSGAVVRIAGILHAAGLAESEPWTVPISASVMRSAIEIADYFTAHAIAAFAEMGADPAVENAKALLRWITKAGQAAFSKRDAFNALRARFRRVAALDPALDLLCQHGWLRFVVVDQPSARGRPPSPIYEVSPFAFLAAHKSPKSQNGVSAHSADSVGRLEPEDA